MNRGIVVDVKDKNKREDYITLVYLNKDNIYREKTILAQKNMYAIGEIICTDSNENIIKTFSQTYDGEIYKIFCMYSKIQMRRMKNTNDIIREYHQAKINLLALKILKNISKVEEIDNSKTM